MEKIIQGDCLDVLKTLPDNSVHCCVTSPPYWNLRDYGIDGQLGLEQTPDEYVEKLVEVFREVRRVLRDDGTLWLNLGDSYASDTKGSGGDSPRQNRNKGSRFKVTRLNHGLKPKDLVGIPWRVAFALQADGWYLRSDIIWHKPNAMPESVKDRPTKAHEYIFLMSKSSRYYYDADAIREPNQINHNSGWAKQLQNGDNPLKYGKKKSNNDRNDSGLPVNRERNLLTNGRNKRTVWNVSTKPFKGAHFAVFPPDLIEPCILAGSPPGGIVLDPFFGSGTTGLVARKHGRGFIGIELNPEYIEIAKSRLEKDGKAVGA